MTRIDELQKNYPNLPRTTIVKWETLRNGIRDSSALNSVGNWMRHLASYQSYDHEISLAEITKEQQRVKPGWAKLAYAYYMKDGIGCSIQKSPISPYEIRELGFGQYSLYEGEEKVEEVYFLRPPMPWPEEPMTSRGTPVTSLITMYSPYCGFVVPLRYCEYFATGEQCKFCSFNPGQIEARSIGLKRPITIDPEETAEAFRLICADTRIFDLKIEAGGLQNKGQESKIFLDFVDTLIKAAPYKINTTVLPQALDRKDLQRLKDIGVDSVYSNIEVWDAPLFADICPGKARCYGHERWKEALLDAVEVFGAGNVVSSLVGAVTMFPKNGHKSWQESRDSMIEGFRWMIKNGVFAIFTNWRTTPGSIYGDNKSLWGKNPPTEYYLDLCQANHELMLEYKLYPKVNKWMMCPYECVVNYAGEVGISALYGNVVNWQDGRPLTE